MREAITSIECRQKEKKRFSLITKYSKYDCRGFYSWRKLPVMMVVVLANAHSTCWSIYYQLKLLSDSNQKVAPVIQAVRLLALRINERTTAVFWPTEFEALETRAWLKMIAKWKKSHGARLERGWRSLVRQSIREFKKLRLVLQRKRLFKIVLRSELSVLLLFYVGHVVRSGRSITLLDWNERLFT